MKDVVGYVSMRHLQAALPCVCMSLSKSNPSCLHARQQTPKLGCCFVES